MTDRLLSVKHLRCNRNDGTPIFKELSFDLKDGEILVLAGKSGVGKSTLLKCLAHLNMYEGEVLLRGKAAKEYGVPYYRTLVAYVPQRTSLLPDTPRAFLTAVESFSARKSKEKHPASVSHPIELATAWNLPEEVWDRPWSTLSGGEAQRVALATAIGMGTAEVLLLDEPTSALDEETSLLVEKELKMLIRSQSSVKALVWITHSHEQEARVATRALTLEAGGRLTPYDNGQEHA